jgi:hypothetical protein
MKLQELSDAWNALRNDALGTGVTPRVPKQLADRVGNTYERWRTWLGNAGPIDDMIAEVSASTWLADYRALASEVAAAGVKLSAPLPTTLGESVSSAVTTVGKLGQTVAIVVAAVSLPLLYLMLGGRKR